MEDVVPTLTQAAVAADAAHITTWLCSRRHIDLCRIAGATCLR
ncbi:MAG: putative leader peptide [Mycobacteriaceae bacterium]